MNTRTVLLWHNNGEERIYFTVNPARLTVTRPNENRVRSLAMGGTVNIWGGRGLREVRLTTFLPSAYSPFFDGKEPESILAMLKSWQDSGDPVRLIISGSDINDAFLIEDVSETLAEGDRDVGLTVTLREYKFKSALAALAGGSGGSGSAPVRKRTDGAGHAPDLHRQKGGHPLGHCLPLLRRRDEVGAHRRKKRRDESPETADRKGADAVKLLIGQQMVMPALESVRLGKTRNEAAACLTATVLIAPADTYFLKLSVAVGDVVRLLDDGGKEIFLGSVHELDRTPETVTPDGL